MIVDEYMEEEDQKLKMVRQIISELNPKQQEIINLRFNYNLSYKEISSLLEITVESCYKSVYRSVSAIRSKAENSLHQKKEDHQDQLVRKTNIHRRVVDNSSQE